MQIHENRYDEATGWRSPLPAGMDSPHTLVLAFGAPRWGADPRPFADLRAAWPQSVLAGCSTSGEMAGAELSDGSIIVVATRFEQATLRHASTDIADPQQSSAAGERLAAALRGPDLRAVFLLSDGLNVNGTSLVSALTAGLPAGVDVTGGLAGDGHAFQQTWILDQDRPTPQRVCAIGLSGPRLHVGSGCDGGWMDFGPLRRITRSAGNVLHELDGRPALDLYKDYLGELAAGLPGTALRFPLSVRPPGTTGRPLVRTCLAIDEQARSMTFAGDLPEGFEARLMRTTSEHLIHSATAAVAQATKGLRQEDPALVISVSCVGRRLVMGERTEEEAEAIAQGTPPRAVHLGFYSYGEIAPGADGGACGLHNQTMTVTAYAET
jgi:hypothetical protein